MLNGLENDPENCIVEFDQKGLSSEVSWGQKVDEQLEPRLSFIRI
jgi:hypothetical protein